MKSKTTLTWPIRHSPAIAKKTDHVPVAEFVEAVSARQPVLANGKVFSQHSENAIFGPWQKCHSEDLPSLCWEQKGYAWVRLQDGFLVHRHGGVFRAFGLLGFTRLKILNPEQVTAGNHWTTGVSIMTTLVFTERT